MPLTSLEKALGISSAFEGEGWGGVSNAGDGQGWSAFTISWCFGQGTLQGVLEAMHNAGPETFSRCCTQHVAAFQGRQIDLSPDLLKACSLSPTEGVVWCSARQDENGAPLLHWRAAFFALGQVDGFRKIQMEKAQYYVHNAQNMMTEFGFISERAFALMLDIAIQDGSINYDTHVRYHQATDGQKLNEKQKLLALAIAIAPEAGKWQGDVLSRKKTIATGSGYVHGKYFDLARDFGLGDGPVV